MSAICLNLKRLLCFDSRIMSKIELSTPKKNTPNLGLKPQYPLKKSTKSPTFNGPYPYSGIKTPVPLHACVILKGMGRANQGIVWVVAGPTASRKSDFALGQAEKRGEIINCDSDNYIRGCLC